MISSDLVVVLFFVLFGLFVVARNWRRWLRGFKRWVDEEVMILEFRGEVERERRAKR